MKQLAPWFLVLAIACSGCERPQSTDTPTPPIVGQLRCRNDSRDTAGIASSIPSQYSHHLCQPGFMLLL